MYKHKGGIVLKTTFRRLIALALTLCICAGLMIFPAQAASFSDVPSGHWAADYIDRLTDGGIIDGMGDGSYQPDGTLTRAQYIKLISSVVGTGQNADAPETADVAASHWAYAYVAEGFSRAILRESDLTNGNFRPDAPVDRQTAALWMVRALGVSYQSIEPGFTDVADDGSELSQALATSRKLGLIEGYPDGSFRPENTLTRAEAAAIICRMIDKKTEMEAPREATNTVEYREDVTVADSGAANRLVSDSDEYSVFENIDSSISQLQTGDVFVIESSDELPGGYSAKVKSISISGSRATIYKDELELGDVLTSIDIYQTGYADASSFENAELGEGVTLLPAEAELMDTIGSYKAKFEISRELAGGIELTGEIEVGIKATLDAEWRAVWDGLCAIDFDVDVDMSSTVGVTGELKKEIEIPLAEAINIKIGGGKLQSVAKLGLYMVISGKGEITVEVRRSESFGLGVGYEDWDFKTKFNTKSETEVDGSASITVTVGPRVQAKVTFLGDLMKMDASLSGGGMLKLNYKWLNLKEEDNFTEENNLFGEEFEITSNNEVSYHACTYCIDGKINPYCSLKLSFKLGKNKVSHSDSLELTPTKFHISSEDGFGQGDCDNYATISLQGEGEHDGRRVVYVDSVEELYAAIASDTEIRLANMVFDFGGGGLDISNLENLSIIGDTNSEFISLDYDDTVVSVFESKNILIKNVSIGHDPKVLESCSAGVVASTSSEVTLENCDIYGCGMYGLGGYYADYTLRDCVIRDCSYAATYVSDSTLSFENCDFLRNAYLYDGGALLAGFDSSMTLKNCAFEDNLNAFLADETVAVDEYGCTYSGNKF